MTQVSVTTALRDLWRDMSGAQKWVTVSMIALFVVVLVASWVNTIQTWSEIRGFEQQATKAEQEKDAALEQAAQIATQIKVREEELGKVEVKQDAKRDEVKAANDAVAHDRDEYERAVKHRTPSDQVPSTDQLCKQLAAAGHPCYPR